MMESAPAVTATTAPRCNMRSGIGSEAATRTAATGQSSDQIRGCACSKGPVWTFVRSEDEQEFACGATAATHNSVKISL